MPRVVRLGDTSTHGGSVVTAAAKFSFEGKRAARKGDLFDCPIHGLSAIVEGSSKYTCERAPIARHGDRTGCGARLISGATKYDIA